MDQSDDRPAAAPRAMIAEATDGSQGQNRTDRQRDGASVDDDAVGVQLAETGWFQPMERADEDRERRDSGGREDGRPGYSASSRTRRGTRAHRTTTRPRSTTGWFLCRTAGHRPGTRSSRTRLRVDRLRGKSMVSTWRSINGCVAWAHDASIGDRPGDGGSNRSTRCPRRRPVVTFIPVFHGFQNSCNTQPTRAFSTG